MQQLAEIVVADHHEFFDVSFDRPFISGELDTRL
jgi:hypothetical protein